jgi:hypothetical protein
MTTANRFAARLALISAMSLSALAAQAAGFDFTNGHFPPEAQTQSTLTRAEVKAEVLDAIAKGQMLSQGQSYLPLSMQNLQTSKGLNRKAEQRNNLATEKTGLSADLGA